MARLMFTNEDERNNNEHTSSIIANDNKSKNAFIATKSDNGVAVPKKCGGVNGFKVRGQLSSGHIAKGGARYGAAAKVLVTESTVSRLASKFGGVGGGRHNRTTKTEIRGGAATTTAKTRPTEKSIVVRNSSVLDAIRFFECELASGAKGEPPLDREGTDDVSTGARNDVVRSGSPKLERVESRTHLLIARRERRRSTPNDDERSERSAKPVLQPKPTCLLQASVPADDENRSSRPQKIASNPENRRPPEVDARSYETSHYHAPKLLTRTDKGASSDFQIVILNKNKRLSIAKDFSLESVLNADDRSDGEKSPSEIRESLALTSLRSNESFLHKYLEQCLEINNTTATGEKGETESPVAHDVVRPKSTSSLHSSLMKTANYLQNRNSDGGYEVLPWQGEMGEDDEGSADHYSDINEIRDVGDRSSNVYDDVIYAELYNREGSEDYETISSKVYSDPSDASKNEFSVTSEIVVSHSDSDSSFEQTNSLYEVKPTSDLSSATTSTFSSSNDCINIKIESPYVYVNNMKSSNSDVSDHEDVVCPDDWDSNENDNPEEISVYRKRPNMNQLRKFKKAKLKFFLHHRSTTLTEKPENTYMDEVCDDFDDSSSDLDPSEMNGHVEAVNQLNKEQTTNVNRSQNIYGFVEKAVRKSLNSLNQIRKIGNSSNNLPLRTQGISSSSSKSVSVEEVSLKNSHSSGETVRWTSFKSKFRPRYSTLTSSTSVFYINPEDLCFDKSETITKKQSNLNNRRRRMTCIELRPARPTSPPPPPPVDKTKFSENHSVSYSNTYSDRSTSSCESKNSVIGTDSAFDLNSSGSSDLHLLFANEPLYQFYAESVAKLTTSDSLDCLTDSDGYEEIASNTSRPSAMELIIPSPNGHGQHRSLWCEVEEVRHSGILDRLSPSKQRLQEAIFEIITSEASYYKSLSVLDKIFACNPLLNDEAVLSKSDWKILFGNVATVRKCSEKLLAALETCWQENIQLTGLCDVVYEHANENFKIFVKYCSNQIYIDRTLKTLKEQNGRFVEIISQLEANPDCHSLSLHSFLMLPMQRITRMPLLLHAVLSRMDPLTDPVDYQKYQITLATVNEIAKECNETARNLERYEEMLLLSRQLEFSRKDVKMFPVASTLRWLIRSGPMVHINPQDIKLTFTRKLTKQTTKFYFFLFNDILVISKKKSDDSYVVFDHCARNMLQMSQLEDNCTNAYRYLLLLTILENHEGKTVEMILNCDSDSTRQRWLEATSSHLTSDNPEEKLYEQWDCPQVSALHAYTAVQPDELSLQAGDVVKVMRKTTDGWYHGERIRDGTTGWFPGNYTAEIASQHTRAKNLRLRHRLLTLSGNYLLQCQQQQQKKL